MSQQESDGSSVVPSENPSERTRHFTDGRAPVTEWQCSGCQTWHPMSTWHVIEFRKERHPEPWCYICRPPKSPALRHLHEGGWTLIGYGGFTEWIKRNAAERRAQGLQGGGAE